MLSIRLLPVPASDLLRIRRWTLWTVPGRLRCYILVSCAIWLVAVTAALRSTSWDRGQLATALLMLGSGAIAIEASKRIGEPAGEPVNNLLGAWYLPIMLLLPPAYSLLAPIPLILLIQIRVQRVPFFRRVFSVASLGLVHGAGSLAFHAVIPFWSGAGRTVAVLLWAAGALACALATLLLIRLATAVAMHLSNPEITVRELALDTGKLLIDICEQCTGVVVALLSTLHPLLSLTALVPVLNLQRAMLHDQLSAAARLDARTGLLNGPAWEREAASEIARADRTHSPLSVLLLDLDHFKRVNDRYGHLAGDAVLCGVADVMRNQTREYDRCARFGGDEFAVLLPQSDAQEALRTAERIRRHVGALRIPAGHDELIRVTVSIGLCQLTGPGQEVTDLLAAADASLYRAKADGRARVRSVHDL